jgi:hypothetical protein
MLKKLAIAASLLAMFGSANAYNYEVQAGYEKTDMDFNVDANTYSLNGKYYFDDVATSGPLAESAFLEKVSNVGVGYAKSSMDLDVADYDIQTYGVRGELFIPNTNFFVGASVNQVQYKLKIDDYGDEKLDQTGYAVEVGYLPVDGLLVAAGIAKNNLDSTAVAKNGFYDSTMSVVDAGDNKTAGTFRAKYVTQIGNYWTNFEGSTIFGDETSYRLGADFYFNPTLSLGVSYADSSADDSESLYGVHAQKFFGEKAAVGLSYTTADGIDAYGVNATFRF